MPEQAFSELLSEFAHTLLSDFPGQLALDHLVVQIVEVLPISGATVTLHSRGGPDIYAASDASVLKLEESRSQSGATPPPISSLLEVPDLRTTAETSEFSARALEHGFAAIVSVPLRANDEILGALHLYGRRVGPLPARVMAMAQTLADVAAAYVIVARARGDLVDAAVAARAGKQMQRKGARELRASILSNEQTDRALVASEARHAAILASATDAVITCDDQLRVTDFNAAAERMFGITADYACDRSVEELIYPASDRAAHRKRLESYLDLDSGVVSQERRTFTAQRDDGSQFPAEVSLHLTIGTGTRLLTGFIRDITAQKCAEAEKVALEERLHQAQRLESLGQLAGGVAHDFNNLLTIILSYASAIGEAAAGNEEIVAQAKEVVVAGERAARLTHQLLTFARRQPFTYGRVDLNAQTAHLKDFLAQTVGEDVHVVFLPGDNLPPVHADRGQTDQVLLNLVVNARTAMPNGGMVTIQTTLLHLPGDDAGALAAVAPGEYVELSVRDSGVGMTADVAARAFEPFFTTQPFGEGTGLGLATVHGIVTDAGGAVTLDSNPGSGTTVRALFPTDRTSSGSPASKARLAVTPGNGRTVLVVDNEPAVLDVTAAMLRRHGYSVLEATNAVDALRIFNRGAKIDLLLTDVVMPGMSGRKLARALHSHHPDLPVLYMSGGLAESNGAQQFVDLGLALLQKPFDEVRLCRAVGEVISAEGPAP